MKGTDILKWGVLAWLGYAMLRELGQPTSDSNHNGYPDLPPTRPGEYSPMTWPVPWRVQMPQALAAPLVPQVSSPTRSNVANMDLANIFEKAINETFGGSTLVGLISPQPKLCPVPQAIEECKWLKLIRHPSIVLILGGRGKGKSTLGYRLLEHLRWIASVYVVGLPRDASKYLPNWVGIAVKLEDVPPDSVVLVDEGYLAFHARRSMTADSVEMSRIVNLSRQRNQTMIFVSQEARQVDKNIASSANVIVFKDMSAMQLEFDRRELSKIAANAKEAFAGVNSADKKKWAYVYAPDSDFAGLVENSLPSFWSERVSHIFATGGEVTARAPERTPLSQRIEKAKQLRQEGLSLGQIARQMGVSKGTIKNWLEDYPYRHKPGQ
ncbi:MAG: hypothetical protein KJ624_08430 [Chloroflexi bacterium]|nr:hypothetical protein [Chloroflexota bacterium]